MNTFVTMITYQVKPGKLEEFEELIGRMKAEQEKMPCVVCAKYMKRFYTFDGVENDDPPRELTKIVKCVKYYAYLEFADIESSGRAKAWFFDNWGRDIGKLLIMPFDMNSGYSV